jgi:hypothetical protein
MIRPSGTYSFVYADEMNLYSGANNVFPQEDFDKGKLPGMKIEFSTPPGDEEIKESVIKFVSDNNCHNMDLAGKRAHDRVCIKWPAGRLENWFFAQRVSLEIEIGTITQDPDAANILEPGEFIILEEDEFEDCMELGDVDAPDEIWDKVDDYNALNYITFHSVKVVKPTDRLSCTRIISWHEEFMKRSFKMRKVCIGKTLDLVLMMRRPSGFVERRMVTYTPIIEAGAAPCKLEDRGFPRWPQEFDEELLGAK